MPESADPKEPDTMNRRLLAATFTCALLAVAGPAWGHAHLDPGTAPRDSEAELTIQVPVEPPRQSDSRPSLDDRHNERVTVEIPDGFVALGCASPNGWSCTVEEGSGKVPHHIAWDRTGGRPFEAEDAFDLTVRTADEAGAYPFETHQTYSDGDVVHWDGPPDSDNPAPVLEVE